MPQPRRYDRRDHAIATAHLDDLDAARTDSESGEYDPNLTEAFGCRTRLVYDEDGNCRIEHG
ncbi:hypothetical protein [Embleya sp. NPDC005971]|uniref:hypothetical protein n=1 Tax=Embleya sp. NPDC005971 TaxID=3156724 RepID=UPI0033EBB59B